MVVKVYISGISGNKEVKKRQQRVLMILDSKNIKYDVIDITEPGRETDKDFMQNNSKSNGGTVSDPNPRSPLPPQLFNDEEYCGDYDQFDLANEVDTLEQFLKLEVPPEQPDVIENDKENTLNGDVSKASKENSQEREATESDKPAEDDKEKSPIKDGTPSREATPVQAASKEATPARDDADEEAEKEESTKEKSPEKETTPERQKSVEKEDTQAKEESPAKEVEEPKATTEEAPAENESVNENGTVSSRDQSEEKEAAGDAETVERKKDPSELLIESEQTAAAE